MVPSDSLWGITPAPGDNSNAIATTAFVQNAIAASGGTPTSAPANEVLAGPATGSTPGTPAYRGLVSADLPVSPALAGTPTAPTGPLGDNSVRIATDAFVKANSVQSVALAAPSEFSVAGSPVTTSGTLTLNKANQLANTVWAGPASGAANVSGFRLLVAADIPVIAESQVANLTSDLASKAALTSPVFTGIPEVPTAPPGDNSNTIADTAYVYSQITAQAPGLAPVQSVAGKTGAVVLNESDITNLPTDLALKAPLASPPFTGNPTAPTAAPGNNSTQIATTAFVTSAVAAGGGGGGLPSASPNTVLAGPTSGSTPAIAAPRALVAADIPGTLNPTVINGPGSDATHFNEALTINTSGAASFIYFHEPSSGLDASMFVDSQGGLGFWDFHGGGSTLRLMHSYVSTQVPVAIGSSGVVAAPAAGYDLDVTSGATNGGTGHFAGALAVGGNIVTSGNVNLSGVLNNNGTPATGVTPAVGDNSTNVATTAFVKNQAYAPLASPTLTGVPTAPTQVVTDNSTDIATTAFVKQGYRLNSIYCFGVSATYTPVTGTRAIFVECVGGGGAGGGANGTTTTAAMGSGGGSGGYASKWITGTIKASYTTVVGAGGTGVAGASGNAGGATTFDSPSVCTANGGSGGQLLGSGTSNIIQQGGPGATASGVGDMSSGGAPGDIAIRISATAGCSGNGGSSALGGGGYGLASATSGANNGGVAGTAPGGGGGGAIALSVGANWAGANGAAGLVRIWEYI